MELFAQIRRDARVEGLSIRALAQRHGVHRRTVRQALENAEPPVRQPRVQSAPKLDAVRDLIDAMLREDLDAPRKQKQTATRIWNRLLDEHDAAVGYPTVRDYVRARRPEIAAEAGVRLEVAMIPQEHRPGAEAEVDFGELYVDLAGVRTKVYLFVFRLSFSGKAVHRVYSTLSQEAFLEGHVAAFEELGGVPTMQIKYDNLGQAVKKVLGPSRRREENDRWVLFRSHYGFDAFYCEPGIAGAHEKGGVEGEVGRFRRTWLSPVPRTESLDELNDRIREWDARDDARRISGKLTTVGGDYGTEQAFLAPLPDGRFEPGLVLTPRVDHSALITIRQAKYSVPAHLIGRQVRVVLRASEILVYERREVVARHERLAVRNGQSVQLDHYLEVLKHKPGALAGSTALARAREAGVFTAEHDAFWHASRRVNGDTAGTRELIDVLLLHRTLPAEAVLAGIRSALGVGSVLADVVKIEARRAHALHRENPEAAEAREPMPKVVSLTQRRLMDPAAVIAGLPPDTRPVPSMTRYDQLLPKRAAREAAAKKTTIQEEGANLA